MPTLEENVEQARATTFNAGIYLDMPAVLAPDNRARGVLTNNRSQLSSVVIDDFDEWPAYVASLSVAGNRLPSPALGAPTLVSFASDEDVRYYQQSHTRLPGSGLCVLLAFRPNRNPFQTAAVFFGDTRMRVNAQRMDTSGVLIVAASLAQNVPPFGVNKMAVALPSGVLGCCGYVIDVIGTRGCAQGRAAEAALNFAPTNADSLILSLAANVGGNDRPTAGPGFSAIATADNGGGATGVAVTMQRSRPQSAASAAVTAGSMQPTRAICAVEWLPG